MSSDRLDAADAHPGTRDATSVPGLRARKISAREARSSEDAFIAGFRRNFGRLIALPNPIEGGILDINPEREYVREWDEREEARRQLLRADSEDSPDDMPVCRTVQYSIVRKPLFGEARPRLSVIAACWSPLEDLARGPVSEFARRAGEDVVRGVLERALVTQRPGLWHFIGICSTTGWSADVLEPLPVARNFSVALIEPREVGWSVRTPPDWPPALRACFDPEGIEEKRHRVETCLRASSDLTTPGGLMLIEDLADEAGVPIQVALDVAFAYSQSVPGLIVRPVEGSYVLQRDYEADM